MLSGPRYIWGLFGRAVTLKGLLLECEKVGDDVHPLCYQDLSEGGGGVLGVCDGLVVEFQEVAGGLSGRRPGV